MQDIEKNFHGYWKENVISIVYNQRFVPKIYFLTQPDYISNLLEISTKQKVLTKFQENSGKENAQSYEPTFSILCSTGLTRAVTKCNLTRYQTTNFRLFQTERVCRRQFQT